MPNPDLIVLAGEIVEDGPALTIDDLCAVCAVERERILELVELGVLAYAPGASPVFAGAALRRARLALRLQRDLRVNAAGAALAIELLERIEVLEARLHGR